MIEIGVGNNDTFEFSVSFQGNKNKPYGKHTADVYSIMRLVARRWMMGKGQVKACAWKCLRALNQDDMVGRKTRLLSSGK